MSSKRLLTEARGFSACPTVLLPDLIAEPKPGDGEAGIECVVDTLGDVARRRFDTLLGALKPLTPGVFLIGVRRDGIDFAGVLAAPKLRGMPPVCPPCLDAGLDPICLETGLDSACLDGGLIIPSCAIERDGGRIGLSVLKKLDLRRLMSGDSGTGMVASVSCTLSESDFSFEGLVTACSLSSVVGVPYTSLVADGALICCLEDGLVAGFLKTSPLDILVLAAGAVSSWLEGGLAAGLLKTS